MRIAYLECFSGISGDMFLGALLDAGVPPELFTRTVEALGVDARLEISRVDRSGISATKLDVIAAGEKELPREEFWENAEPSARLNPLPRSRSRACSRVLAWPFARTRSTSTPPEIPTSIRTSDGHEPIASARQGSSALASRTERNPPDYQRRRHQSELLKIAPSRFLKRLGAAEAKVHNTDIEKIHFHEVGAIDAIVDIVCASVGSEALGVDEWICSPLNVGGGTVVCAHGTFPDSGASHA